MSDITKLASIRILDAQYHLKCLVSLYNCMPSTLIVNPTGRSWSMSVQAGGALAELALYISIEESAQNENMHTISVQII